MFHIPGNILEIFDPWKNYRLFIDMEQRRLPQYDKPITHYFDWKPLPSITIVEAEQFFQEELGMVKVEIDDLEQEFIVSRQYLHEGMQYTCTYMCPNHEVRNKWATQKEKIDYVSTQKVCDDAVKLMLDRADETGDPDGLYKKYAAEWERRKQRDDALMLHLYCDSDGWFADIDVSIVLPLVVLLSLYHLMGRAPVSEDTFSHWPLYLQFLIDIGYVNDFVKEFTIVENI